MNFFPERAVVGSLALAQKRDDVVADSSVHSEDAIIEWLVEHVARELKTVPDAISVDEAFFDIGLNSLNTLIVSGELGEFLGYEDFNPTLFWDYPTIRKLAGHLAAEPPAARAGNQDG